MKLFISYAPNDRTRVEELASLLNEAGHEAWVDHTLTSGQRWEKELKEQVESCDAFVYAVSRELLKSEWGKREFRIAKKAKMPIFAVVINSNAKSDIPSASATPVSIVAREILQYASTIKEAYAIAEKRRMFVAESFLIGSASENKASVIEKTPDGIDFYESASNYIISTNHFQGAVLGNTQLNKDHMKTSASVYRLERVEELLLPEPKNSVVKTAIILRNQLGKGNLDIGLGNEKSINQLVAHHSIIFQPDKGLVWVSTTDWQLGKFVCYDLNKVFAGRPSENVELYESALTIPADSFLLTPAYNDYLKFSKYRFPFNPKNDLVPDSVVKWNPNSYHAYMLAGKPDAHIACQHESNDVWSGS